MIANALSACYGAAATWRRRWYASDATRTKALARPVISVGNLRAGGSGKTPLVAHLAASLVARGERPAILSRGYGRRDVRDGVTVVSDGHSVLAGLDRAGDEPLMLARSVPGACVVVGADRYLAGVLAEAQLGASLHILDDGFQHVRLRRTVDLLLVDPRDLEERVIPAGHLREPLANARLASAVVVVTDDDDVMHDVGRRLSAANTFRVSRVMHAPRTFDGNASETSGHAVALAGIAKPDQFFAGVRSLGIDIASTMVFRDHHRFTRADVARIINQARRVEATAIVTTAKDAVRLEPFAPLPIELRVVPLDVTVHPQDEFETWLLSRLGARA